MGHAVAHVRFQRLLNIDWAFRQVRTEESKMREWRRDPRILLLRKDNNTSHLRLDLQSNTYVMPLELPTHTCAIYSHSFPGPSPGDRLSYTCPHSPSAPPPTVSPAPRQLRRVLGTLKTEFGSLCVSNDPPQCCETAQRDSIHWPNLTLDHPTLWLVPGRYPLISPQPSCDEARSQVTAPASYARTR